MPETDRLKSRLEKAGLEIAAIAEKYEMNIVSCLSIKRSPAHLYTSLSGNFTPAQFLVQQNAISTHMVHELNRALEEDQNATRQ